MGQIKAVALDFDNCIILDWETRKGSEEVKDEAWFKVFPEIPRMELEPELEKIKQRIVGGKGDQWDVAWHIILMFSSRLTPRTDGVPMHTITEPHFRCTTFNNHVQEGIKEIGVSEIVRQTLAALSKTVPLYINTATPTDAVLQSLDNLALTKYFKSVLGRPKSKAENLSTMLLSEDLARPTELLFVGDQESDLIAAQKIGCRFVGMQTARNTAWYNTPLPFPLIFSLAELTSIVKNHPW